MALSNYNSPQNVSATLLFENWIAHSPITKLCKSGDKAFPKKEHNKLITVEKHKIIQCFDQLYGKSELRHIFNLKFIILLYCEIG